jgi:hypothetical protein
MDSGNRRGNTADGENFEYFVHVSCTFRLFFQKSISEICREPQKLFLFAYARGRQMTLLFFLHILRRLLALDVERLTWLIAVIRVYCYMLPHGSYSGCLIKIIFKVSVDFNYNYLIPCSYFTKRIKSFKSVLKLPPD